jgi:hypothetical protein
MKLFFIIQTLAALSNYFYQPADKVPDPAYLNGMERLYPAYPKGDRNLPALNPGEAIAVFLRFTRMENIRKTFTSVYFPRTDEYSALVVPNS